MKINRKELKKSARQVVKRHYLFLMALCLAAAAMGIEFNGSLDFLDIPSPQQMSEQFVEDAVNRRTTGVVVEQPSMENVLIEALNGDAKKSREIAAGIKQRAIDNANARSGHVILGRSRGVLANLVNEVTSGAVLATLITATGSILGSPGLTWVFFIILSVLLFFFVYYFFLNVYRVIIRRVCLEGRVYDEVPAQRMLYLLRLKKWCNVVRTLFVAELFQFLWMFTIIGGIIKHYAYFMVPYIAAENPDIGARSAVRLSQDMMKGHKWECFVLEASYLGWELLGIVTFGISRIVYSNAYKLAGYCEYYAARRSEYIEARGAGYEFLNDRYLFEKADEWELMGAYSDVIFALLEEKEENGKNAGLRDLLTNTFGIVLSYSDKEKKYLENENQKLKIELFQDASEGKVYPARLSPIREQVKRSRLETVHYLRYYSVWSLGLMFFLFSIVGWLWEVCMALIMSGEFVNRGVLHGPWLPIYGAGGVLILTVLNSFRRRPGLEGCLIALLCGSVEYFTAVILEWMHNGQKWWDYSGYFLNIQGRVCAEGLMVFTIGGLAIVYLIAPMVDNLIHKIPQKFAIVICTALFLGLAADVAYSAVYPNVGTGITDYVTRRGL